MNPIGSKWLLLLFINAIDSCVIISLCPELLLQRLAEYTAISSVSTITKELKAHKLLYLGHFRRGLVNLGGI